VKVVGWERGGMSTGECNVNERVRECFEYCGTFGAIGVWYMDHAIAGTRSGIRRGRDP